MSPKGCQTTINGAAATAPYKPNIGGGGGKHRNMARGEREEDGMVIMIAAPTAATVIVHLDNIQTRRMGVNKS